MNILKSKLLVPLACLLTAGAYTPAHALKYVAQLDEPGVYRIEPRGTPPRVAAPRSQSRKVAPSSARPMSHQEMLAAWKAAARRNSGETRRNMAGVHQIGPRLGQMQGRWQWEEQRAAMARRLAEAQQHMIRNPRVAIANYKPVARGTSQRAASYRKPSGPPAGYHFGWFSNDSNHWVKDGTNRTFDNKANHHPQCPGCHR